MKQSETIAKLTAALVKVQDHIQPVAKDRVNSHFKNRYATLDAIMESVRAPLASVGLAVIQGGGAPVSNINGDVVGVGVETMLVHESGEYISSIITLPIAQASPQTVGSAMTYGRRYGVAALLALTTEEDDDGHHAQAVTQHATAQRTTQPPARVLTKAETVKALDMEPVRASNSASASKKMPFGKHKGTLLGNIESKDLESTITWASSDSEKQEKFKELIAACQDVLSDRLVGSTIAAVEAEDSGLPF